MRANRRRDKSSAAHEIELQDSNGFEITHIGIRDARQGVEDGVYEAEYAPYRMGTLKENREIIRVRLKSHRQPSLRVRPPITRGEADAAVGLHGQSHTFGMSEFQKQMRVLKIREKHNHLVQAEDHIELAIGKLAFYPVATDVNNPATVGPRVDYDALAKFVDFGEAELA